MGFGAFKLVAMEEGELRLWEKSRVIFVAVIFCLFIFSTFLKLALKNLLDPTLVLGLILIPILLISSNRNFVLPNRDKNLILLAFFFWILITTSYTISIDYWKLKTLKFIQLIVAVMLPISFFYTRERIAVLTSVFLKIGFLGYSYLSLLIIGNYLNIGVARRIYENSPDYLSMGSFLGLFLMVYLFGRKESLTKWILIAIGVVDLILLSGRGPILTLVLLFVFYFISRKKRRVEYLLFGIVGGGLVLLFSDIFLSLPIFEKIIFRFSGLQVNPGSMAGRNEHLENIMLFLNDDVVWGIGWGGYGQKYFGMDGRLYPHNLLAEVFIELGIFGLTIFSVWLIKILKLAILLFKSLAEYTFIYSLTIGFIFLLMQSMKSSSIIDARLMFGVIGVMCAFNEIIYKEKSLP